MLEEQEKRLPRYHDINEANMSILLSYIIWKTSLPKESEQDTWKAMADYINDNLNGGLSLEALAKKCFYNPSYFSRLFKIKIPCVFSGIRQRETHQKTLSCWQKVALPHRPPKQKRAG